MYRWSTCVFVLGALLVSETWAAPPAGRGSHGGGGSSGGFGFSIGGSQGLGFQADIGNVPYHDNRGYRGGDYYRGSYNRDYYDRSYHGNSYGGSGLYLGGGSSGFRWGVGVPFGYDDYDWYAPYYNYYHRHYYNVEPDYYYQGSDYYYGGDNTSNAAAPPAMEHPPVPTAGQVARLTDDQLRMMIAMALDSYSRELDGFTTGAGWKKHFKLTELKTLVTATQAGPLDASARSLVADVSQKLDDAAKDPTYEVLTTPWSFQTLQVALKEYSSTAMQRQAHLLNAKSQSLKRSLDSISTGGGWKVYLKIDELENLLSQSPPNSADLNTKLEKILLRFDEVNKNPEYKAVADLQGFDVTRTALQLYINTLQKEMPKQNDGAQPADSASGKVSL